MDSLDSCLWRIILPDDDEDISLLRQFPGWRGRHLPARQGLEGLHGFRQLFGGLYDDKRLHIRRLYFGVRCRERRQSRILEFGRHGSPHARDAGAVPDLDHGLFLHGRRSRRCRRGSRVSDGARGQSDRQNGEQDVARGRIQHGLVGPDQQAVAVFRVLVKRRVLTSQCLGVLDRGDRRGLVLFDDDDVFGDARDDRIDVVQRRRPRGGRGGAVAVLSAEPPFYSEDERGQDDDRDDAHGERRCARRTLPAHGDGGGR